MNGPRIPVLLNQWVCNIFMFSARAARKRNRILLSQNNFASRIFSFLTELFQKLSKTLLTSNQLSKKFDKISLKNTDARVIYERISSEIFKNLGRVIYERTSYMSPAAKQRRLSVHIFKKIPLFSFFFKIRFLRAQEEFGAQLWTA